jgi:threonine synthase
VAEVVGLRCIRCQAGYTDLGLVKGCPACLSRGLPTNVAVEYDYDRIRRSFHPRDALAGPMSMWRYSDLLPVPQTSAVTMGEGMTPLVPVPRLAKRLGLRELYVKDESRNPTSSFKDRLASCAISVARERGARVITGSSSGNAGAATAAFSARAGLPCVMFTTQQFPQAMKAQMAVYGTKLLAAPTVPDRWRLVEAGVDQLGWFPVTVFVYPLVGSNPYGIEGYKTIAYELVEQLGHVPPHVVFPVGAGDAFFGAWKGFDEYRQLGYTDSVPRMHAAEIFGPLENAISQGLDHVEETESGPTVAISVGLNMSTYQALHVLRATHGAARSADDQELIDMQIALASDEGMYLEASSVLSLVGVQKMVAAGDIDPAQAVVAFLTSSGLKDPEMTLSHMNPIPTCDANLESALQVLRDSYHFDGRGVAVGPDLGGDS